MLKYRVPQNCAKEIGKQQRPKVLLGLKDAQRAMGLLRQQPSSYGINPHKVGVIGFSAGAYFGREHEQYRAAHLSTRGCGRPAIAMAQLCDCRLNGAYAG